jgi:hypothetical protein
MIQADGAPTVAASATQISLSNNAISNTAITDTTDSAKFVGRSLGSSGGVSAFSSGAVGFSTTHNPFGGGVDTVGNYPFGRHSPNCKMMCCFNLPCTFQQRSTRNEYMNTFSNRLDTFQNNRWPWQMKQLPYKLALSGFFCRSEGDMVECCECGSIVAHWEATDDINIRHAIEAKRHNKKCKYVSPYNPDVTRVPTGARTQINDQYSHYLREKKEKDLSTIRGRTETFEAHFWPVQLVQSKEKMAESGFFYLGYGDHVKCFYCGLQVHDWLATDCPFQQHYRWARNSTSTGCPYANVNAPGVYVADG